MTTLTLRPNDTLASLSRQGGVPACMLLRANRLTPEQIRPGMHLTVDPTYCLRNGLCSMRSENRFSCTSRRVETLQSGQTLYDVARATGVPIRLILLENDLNAPDDAQPGAQLAIPDAQGMRLHTLCAPESPRDLALRLGVDARELMYVNRIPAGTSLLPGQQVMIPAA